MSSHSVAQAKNKLRVDQSRASGGGVVITRHGRPVVELKAIERPSRRMTEADFEWLHAHRARLTPAKTDAGTFVSQMRDEEWDR